MSLKILAIGEGLPQKILTNEALAEMVETSDSWIRSRTGIESRRICTEETMTDLTEMAAREALDKAGMKPEDLDLILCTTIAGDYTTPSLACTTGERLGTHCPALDMNAACAGFIYALDMAAAYIETNRAKHVLILSAEMMSKHVDWKDRNTCVLFGDGASAVIVAPGNALKYIRILAEPKTEHLYLLNKTGNSPFYRHPVEEHYLHMDGQEVFRFAVTMIEREVRNASAALGIPMEKIDWFLLHQANKRILATARERLGAAAEKFPTNIENTGNISSVTVPLLMNRMLGEGRIKKGDILFMSAFGAGMTAGSCVMIWE